MNTTLQNLHHFGRSVIVGLSSQATPEASSIPRQRNDTPGSYGRGTYAGCGTHTLDFRTQGSYGRGVYARHSTADFDFGSQGSYGRGSYAGRNTTDLDFGAQGSFADGV